MGAAYLLLFSSVFLSANAAQAQTQGKTLTGESFTHPSVFAAPRQVASLTAKRDRVRYYRMAVKYDTGTDEERDPGKAAQFYRKAADLGHPEAMTALGMLHHEGRGVEHDEARAAHWYRRGAGAGSAVGSFNLAVMLSGGSSLPPDLAQARSLYTQAAERGYAKAQYNLALLLAESTDGPADVEQAYKWLTLARDAGIGQAEGDLATLARRLNPEQLSQAAELARQWRPAASD